MGRLQEVLENKQDNYILPFFWQHGEDEATLREYMEVIENANIKAVCVESRPHPDFCGDKWWQDMDVILDEAKKRGMKVWILDDSHFPTGFANGAVEKASNDLKHWYLCYRTLEMAGPIKGASFEIKEYMEPEPLPPWIPQPPKDPNIRFDDDELVGIYVCEILEESKLAEPVDITDKLVDGTVELDLEGGYYKIFVVRKTRNADGRNNYINFLDEDSCRLLIDAVYEPHYAHYKELFGNVIAGFFSDEPPIGNVPFYNPVGPVGDPSLALPWSKEAGPLFDEEFGSNEWRAYIPYLWNDAADYDMQAKIRCAYMEMVTKLVAKCFSNQNGKWCKDHGVEYIGHMVEDGEMSATMGCSMGHYFRGLSGQHMAGIDNIGGQVTIAGQNVDRHVPGVIPDEAGFYQYLIGKMGASHGAIDPKKKGRTMCENFGAYGWQSGTKEQKHMMDHFMVRGVNNFVPHAFSPAPFPDPDCPPHFYAHGENPLYRSFGELMAYSNRVCHLISGGKPQPDVALLYNASSRWAGEGESNVPAARALSTAQIDFNLLPEDVFNCLYGIRGEYGDYPVEFDGSRLKVNGVEYKALVISKCRYLPESVEKFIDEAVNEGFPVVFESNGDIVKQLRELIDFEVKLAPANKLISTLHYINEENLYLFLNEDPANTYDGYVLLKGKGYPVKYNPWENKLYKLDCRKENPGIFDKLSKTQSDESQLHLKLEPLELAIITFVDEKYHASLPYEFEKGELYDTIDTLEVSMISSKDYLAECKKGLVEGQQKHTLSAPFIGMQKEYKDFSGYYIYETKLDKCNEDLILSIDDAHEAVEVFINGKSIGTKVMAPFDFIITSELLTGDDSLRIEVATLLERKHASLGVDRGTMSAFRPFSPTGIVGNINLYKIK